MNDGVQQQKLWTLMIRDIWTLQRKLGMQKNWLNRQK